MASTSEAAPGDEIQLADFISPTVLERTPQVNESLKELAPTIFPRHRSSISRHNDHIIRKSATCHLTSNHTLTVQQFSVFLAALDTEGLSPS
jgi:hypothetical protein